MRILPDAPREGNPKTPAPPADRLALRPAEAARALGISPRMLWSLTNRRLIPCVRIGRRVLYAVPALEAWLAKGGDQ